MPENILAWISRHRWLLAAVSLMLLVAGGRLAVVANYGTDLPVQDSWAADSRAFIIPLGNGNFSPKTLFYPTNEHRVFFTNLCNAILAAVSGRWDNRQQTVLNAFLCGVVLAGTWYALARSQSGAWPAVTFAVVAAAGGLPIIFENIVWGFQSQFLFVAGFSLYCLWQLLTAPVGSRRWHTGWIAGLCAMLSLGSGFFAPLVVVVLSLVRFAQAQPGARRPALLTAAVAGLLLGFAWMVHNPAPQHDVLHATSLTQFFNYLLAGMAWPATGLIWLAPLTYAPLAWLAWRWCREPPFRGSLPTFLLGAGLWAGLQIAAIAFARSNTTMWPPANRYGELYLYGVILNVAAGVLLVTQPVSPRQRPAALVLLCLVLGAFGFGAVQATRHALVHRLPETRAEFRVYEKNVAAYVRSPDRQLLDHVPIPYPNSFILANLLDMRAVQKYLPASVRAPSAGPSDLQRLLGKTSSQTSFLSAAALQVARSWPLFLGLGVIGAFFVAAVVISLRQRSGRQARPASDIAAAAAPKP